MSNGNPFYVKPAAAMVDVSPLAEGLGTVAARAREKRERTRIGEELKTAMSSGDPAQVMAMHSKYPELSDAINNQIGYVSDESRNIFTDSYINAMTELRAGQRIDEDGTQSFDPAAVKRAEEIMLQGSEKVASMGGKPWNMQYDMEELNQDPSTVYQRMQMGLAAANPDMYKMMYGTAAGDNKMQFGGQEMFKDEAGNTFFATTRRNPQTGAVESVVTPVESGTQQKGSLVPAGGAYGETARESMERKAEEYTTKKTEENRIAAVESYRAKLPAMSTELRELDNIIDAIDRGADTGVIANYFPTVTRATSELFQAARRLGLNIIQNTTFGALSVAEMNLAMETAVPTGLDQAELREWAQNKKLALYKIQNEVQSAIDHLNAGKPIEQWYAQRGKVRQYREQGINVGARRRDKKTGQIQVLKDDGEWHNELPDIR